MALKKLLTQCSRCDEAEALETLRLNPEIFNDPWGTEGFFTAADQVVHWGDTAIMAASKGGSERLVRELVRLGADVNARRIDDGYEGWDALMYASEKGHAAVVAVLLDNGADPNSRNQECSALGIAAA